MLHTAFTAIVIMAFFSQFHSWLQARKALKLKSTIEFPFNKINIVEQLND